MKKSLKGFFKFLGLAFVFLVVLFAAAFAILPLPGHVTVLMYHFIDTPQRAAVEKNVISEKSFARQMKFLKTFGYQVIPMDDYAAIKAGLRKPNGRQILITFDDGEYSFYTKALPVLKKYNFPATVFVVSQNMLRHEQGSMTLSQVQEISKDPSVTIGSHTRTHPVLGELSEKELFNEVVDSKREIEEVVGRPVRYFAYPYGRVDPKVIEMVKKAGYRLAFATAPKKNKDITEGPLAISRVKVSRTSDFWFAFWIKVSGLYELLKYWF